MVKTLLIEWLRGHAEPRSVMSIRRPVLAICHWECLSALCRSWANGHALKK